MRVACIPLAHNARFASSRPDTTVQRQLDQINAQTLATAATLKVVGDVKQLAITFQDAQSTIAKAFTDSTAISTANNLLSSAQADVSNLTQSISTHNILLNITPPENQADIRTELENLREQLKEARTTNMSLRPTTFR